MFNANSGNHIAVVNTHGTARSDELAYDKKDDIIVVTNPDETSGQPFYTLINATTHQILGQNQPGKGKYFVPGATSLEQPAWDAVNGLFYMAIPSTTTNPSGGEVAVIDPTNLTNPFVKADAIGSDCSPSGLAIDEIRQQAAVGCFGAAEILDLRNGTVVSTYPQITDTDEVWFNPGDRRWYFGSFTFGTHQSALGVVSALTQSFVTNIQLNDGNFHGAAADLYNNEIFFPLDGKGIVVMQAK